MLKKVLVVFMMILLVLGLSTSIFAYDDNTIVNITRAPAEMKIDANFDEWSTGTIIAPQAKDASSCSGIAYFMYDQDYLYIAGE